MIKRNLKFAENSNPDQGEESMTRLEAIESIKALLFQIDLLSEKIPTGDSQRFIELLTSLKGSPLNEQERRFALEISG